MFAVGVFELRVFELAVFELAVFVVGVLAFARSPFVAVPVSDILKLRQALAGRSIVWQVFSSEVVGIDLGITSLLALSTGEKIANPKGFKAKYRKLRRAQKALRRKQKGSNNRHKARLKVAKVHQEIADARIDNLHKLTTRLVRENQIIAVENLAVKNMIKNPQLALAISDASWG